MANVVMEHPDLGEEARQTVTVEQYDLIWQYSGWVVVEGEWEKQLEEAQNPPVPSYEDENSGNPPKEEEPDEF